MRPQVARNLLGEAFDDGFIGDVAGEGECAAADSFDSGDGGGGLLEVKDGYVITAGGEQLGGAAADALGCSGDGGDFL